MAKLMIAASVLARDNVIARASVRLEGTVDAGKVVTDKTTVDPALPYEIRVLHGLSVLIEEMAAAGVSGTVFVASRVFPRILLAFKLLDRHNAADIMILPWMKQEGLDKEYHEVFIELLAALRRAKNRKVTVLVREIYELYKVRLEGAEGLVGASVDLHNGISEEYGVQVVGNDRFAGTVVVISREERGRTVLYGEIVEDSLPGRAKSFIEYGRKAVNSTLALLPKFVARKEQEEAAIAVNGNF